MKRFLGFLICLFMIACEPRSTNPITSTVQVTELPNSSLIYNDGNTKVIKIMDNDTTCYLATNITLRLSPSIFCIK